MIHSDCFYQMIGILGKQERIEFELNEQNLQDIFDREEFGGTERLGVKDPPFLNFVLPNRICS